MPLISLLIIFIEINTLCVFGPLYFYGFCQLTWNKITKKWFYVAQPTWQTFLLASPGCHAHMRKFCFDPDVQLNLTVSKWNLATPEQQWCLLHRGEKKKTEIEKLTWLNFFFFFNPCNLFLWLATNRAHQKNFLIQRTTNYTRGLAVRHLAAFKPGRRWRWQYAPTHLLPTLHD